MDEQEFDLRRRIEWYDLVSGRKGLKLSVRKTKVMVFGEDRTACGVTTLGPCLGRVKFCLNIFLGCVVNENGKDYGVIERKVEN